MENQANIFERTPKLEKRLFDPEDGMPGRKDLRISLTTACDRQCFHCHNEGPDVPWKTPRQEVTLEDIAGLIAHADRHGLNTVTFSGGDPGVYTKFDELMTAVSEWKDKYINIRKWAVCTNGAPFLNAKRYKALADSELNHATFGIDSVEPGELSKPSSPKGKSAAEIIDKVVKPLIEAWPGRSFKFDTVLTGTDALSRRRVFNVIRTAMHLGIDVSIIEVNGVMGRTYDVRKAFVQLIREVAEEYSFEAYHYIPLREVYLYDQNRKARIKFYPDHCASMDCHTCGLVHMRVGPSADGLVGHPCFLQSRSTIKLQNQIGMERVIDAEAWEDFVQFNGGGPDWDQGSSHDKKEKLAS
jgi:molybdenum cofactor biosynthesis enzyme MoaA